MKAIEDGAAAALVTEAMHQREAELREVEEELAALTDAPKVDIEVIPTWVRQQLEDLSDLLLDDEDAALRTKAELHRLNVQFTLSPIRDQGRPFLRVEGTGDLDALCGIRNLPGTSRKPPKTAPTPPPHHLSTGGLSLPRWGL